MFNICYSNVLPNTLVDRFMYFGTSKLDDSFKYQHEAISSQNVILEHLKYEDQANINIIKYKTTKLKSKDFCIQYKLLAIELTVGCIDVTSNVYVIS